MKKNIIINAAGIPNTYNLLNSLCLSDGRKFFYYRWGMGPSGDTYNIYSFDRKTEFQISIYCHSLGYDSTLPPEFAFGESIFIDQNFSIYKNAKKVQYKYQNKLDDYFKSSFGFSTRLMEIPESAESMIELYESEKKARERLIKSLENHPIFGRKKDLGEK